MLQRTGVTRDNLVLLGWMDKVFCGDKTATYLDVGTCVTINGEVGEIVKVQRARGPRGTASFDVKVADKMRAKVKPSELKPAVYEVQELVDGLVDTVLDDGAKQSLQRVRVLLRALLPTPPFVITVPRGEEKEGDGAGDGKTQEEKKEEEEDGEKEDDDAVEGADEGEKAGEDGEDDEVKENDGQEWMMRKMRGRRVTKKRRRQTRRGRRNRKRRCTKQRSAKRSKTRAEMMTVQSRSRSRSSKETATHPRRLVTVVRGR